MTMPVLNSLHINLHQEEEVDFLLRNLPMLQVLNGLVVERDAIFSEDEDCTVNSTDLLEAGAKAAESNNQTKAHIIADDEEQKVKELS